MKVFKILVVSTTQLVWLQGKDNIIFNINCLWTLCFLIDSPNYDDEGALMIQNGINFSSFDVNQGNKKDEIPANIDYEWNKWIWDSWLMRIVLSS